MSRAKRMGALFYGDFRKQEFGKDLLSERFGADLSEWIDKGYNPSP